MSETTDINTYAGGSWAIVSMLGHRTLAGRLSGHRQFGQSLALVIPATDLPGRWVSGANGAKDVLCWLPPCTRPEQLRGFPWSSVYEIATVPEAVAREKSLASPDCSPDGWARPEAVAVRAQADAGSVSLLGIRNHRGVRSRNEIQLLRTVCRYNHDGRLLTLAQAANGRWVLYVDGDTPPTAETDAIGWADEPYDTGYPGGGATLEGRLRRMLREACPGIADEAVASIVHDALAGPLDAEVLGPAAEHGAAETDDLPF